MAGREHDDTEFLAFADRAVAEVAARVPALDREAMQLVLGLHRLTNVVIYDLESGVHRPHGWSFAGFRLLFVLWVDGSMEARRAAELSGMSRAAISGLANTLERDGLIARTASPTDGRAVRLSLTAQGEQRLESAFVEHNARESRWAGVLEPADRSELVRLLGLLSASALAPDVRHRD